MTKPFLKHCLIFLILIFLTISAFVIRFNNFSRSASATIDEIVYARMGFQMAKDPFDYNTLAYGQDLAASGRPLPKYFFEPLFKHPPLFSALIAASFRINGPEFASAIYPSLLAGVLSIILIYLLGTLLYSKTVGLFAAFLLWLDPVSIVCSQKIWMDSVIAFFTLLAAVCFAHAIKNKRPWFFVWSGLAAGMAVNTKYTGLLILFVFLIYAVIYDRQLFKLRHFRIGMALPVLTLTPWFLWNIAVYGKNDLIGTLRGHSELNKILEIVLQNTFLFIFLFCALLAAQIVFKFLTRRKKIIARQAPPSEKVPAMTERLSYLLVIVLLSAWFRDYILRSFDFWNIPSGTWYQGVFSREPSYFYIGRLIEFSAIYLFGIISLLTFHRKAPKEESIVRLSAGLILIFFILWRNYQSRYILSAIPFILLLSADLLIKTLRWAEQQPFLLRLIFKPALILLVTYAVAKTATIDMIFAFPSDMCYF